MLDRIVLQYVIRTFDGDDLLDEAIARAEKITAAEISDRRLSVISKDCRMADETNIYGITWPAYVATFQCETING